MNLLKTILISTEIVYYLNNKIKQLIDLLKKNFMNFRIWEKNLTLIIWYISAQLKKEVRKILVVTKPR